MTSRLKNVLGGMGYGAGLGALTGALEVVLHSASTLRLMMTRGEWLTLYAGGSGLYATAGAALGFFSSLVFSLLLPRRPATALCLSVGGVAAGLALLTVAPDAVDGWQDPRRKVQALLLVGVALAIGAVVGWMGTRGFRRAEAGHPPRPSFSTALGILLLLGAATGLGLSHGAGPSGKPSGSDRPNLLFISLDTVRASRLGLYGGASGAQTPFLDELGRSGVWFRHAIAPQPETGPSHSTMFTGLHPLHHGMTSNAEVLRSDLPTLAEKLREDGYATAGFVSAYALDTRTGISRGFDTYDDDFSASVRGLNTLALRQIYHRVVFAMGKPAQLTDLERPAPATTARALAWMDEHPQERFFLWLHYFDAHAPYIPHGLPGFEDNGTPQKPALDHPAILDSRRNEYRPEEVERLKRLYAEEVSFLDGELRTLMEGLTSRGAMTNTVVVVVGDHGESMDEHGIFFSHNGLYDTVLRVPLLMKIPGQAPRPEGVDPQVRMVDLYPTLGELLKIPWPGRSDGSSLVPLLAGTDVAERQALVIGRMGHIGADLYYGLRSQNWKYIRAPGGEEELYLFPGDPCERVNVASQQPKAVEQARAALLAVVGDRMKAAATAPPASTELEEKLRALGYMGTPGGEPGLGTACDEPGSSPPSPPQPPPQEGQAPPPSTPVPVPPPSP